MWLLVAAVAGLLAWVFYQLATADLPEYGPFTPAQSDDEPYAGPSMSGGYEGAYMDMGGY
jgi:hypothetical protein